ncbi:MAG: molybdopterin-dependent oxidoreductase [Pseudonocardiaceae bacterium]|nr:molybdopterin-dependent oxidoreductase [Pseudonocardiaceae bacterium]
MTRSAIEDPNDVPARPSLPAGTAALVGVLAVAAALAAGHLVAALVGSGASPYLAVGNAAIDLTPEWLKEFAIRTFGEDNKLVLLAGMAVVLLLVAVLAGLISRRGSLPGTLLAVGLGVVGLVAVFTRPDVGQLAVLAPATSLLVGVGVFRWLHRLALARVVAVGATETDQALPRRAFLRASTGVALGAGVLGAGGQLLTGGSDATGSRRALGRITPASPAPPIPPGADFAAQGTPRFITPSKDFYRVDTALVVPQLAAEDWRLRVHGMVDRELVFNFDDVRSRELRERTITMVCVSNEVGGPYISTANFVGVPIAELLREAGVRDGAEQLFSTSTDGYTAGTDLTKLTNEDDGAMLAIGMNGESLPVEHGFPARMVVPGLYGYLSATKWVVDMELTTWEAKRPYWLDRGWAREAPVKTASRIDAPGDGATVAAGRVVVSGIAWAQPRGIDKVEVRVDGGRWLPAELSTGVSTDTWRMWRIAMDLEPGRRRVECRATDSSGYQQTGRRTPTAPDGATGWHSVTFTVG